MARDGRRLLLLMDAGASHTRALVVAPDGRILGVGQAGGSNPFAIGETAAAAQLRRAIRAALARARQPARAIALAAIGSAGVGCDGTGRRATERLLSAQLPQARLLVEADVAAAFRAALGGAPGVVVIAGTGTIVLGRSPSGRFASAGGWGWLFGDEGSGQWLGRQAMAAAARAEDRSGPPTRLLPLLLRHSRAASLWRLVTRAYRERWTPAQYGTLAPLVTRAADAGDLVARRLIADAMQALAAQIGAVASQLRLRSPRISYQGSVFSAGPVVLKPLRRALAGGRLVAPAWPPLAGSFVLALEALGAPAAAPLQGFLRQLPPDLQGIGRG